MVKTKIKVAKSDGTIGYSFITFDNLSMWVSSNSNDVNELVLTNKSGDVLTASDKGLDLNVGGTKYLVKLLTIKEKAYWDKADTVMELAVDLPDSFV